MQVSLGSSHAGMTQRLLQQPQITSSYLYYDASWECLNQCADALSSIPARLHALLIIRCTTERSILLWLREIKTY